MAADGPEPAVGYNAAATDPDECGVAASVALTIGRRAHDTDHAAAAANTTNNELRNEIKNYHYYLPN